MYSSATLSSWASGLSGGGLLVCFGEGDGEGVEEEDSEGEGEGFERRDGFSVAVGDASWSGFTGPVGCRGGGAGLAVGVGEGEGAAATIPPATKHSSTMMNGRDLMGAAAGPP